MFPLKVKHVFIDIDGTITEVMDNPYSKIPGIGHDCFRCILRDMLTKKFGVSPSLALTKIQEKDLMFGGCIFRIAPALGIPEEELWKRVIVWQKRYLSVYADAVDMVKDLFSKGFFLYVISNNSCKGILAKLAMAGLAKRNHSPYFREIYGMDLFGFGWSKNNPEVYHRILSGGKMSLKEIAIVGDELIGDLKSPRKAGIKHCFIIDRKQREKIVTKDAGIFVKTLKAVPEMLEVKREI